MAPVYADHPFQLIQTPIFLRSKEGKDGEPDAFDRLSSEMCLVHNMIIRGLNSIYLQAPHIDPKDEFAFCSYILAWFELLHTHHSGEEEEFFPFVEEMAGEQGIMEKNVEQHHLFHDGLEAFITYAQECVDKKQRFNGKKAIELIDSFGKILIQHLTEEIDTLQDLRKYGEKMDKLEKFFEDEGHKAMKKMSMTKALTGGAFGNLDIHFEGGMWKSWPPAPWFIVLLIRNVIWWFHSDWWKFSSCDRFGKLKPLYAVPENQ